MNKEPLTIESLKAVLEKVAPLQMKGQLSIPVYFSPYALPEAVYVPTIGIVCLDQSAFERYQARVEAALRACQ